MSFECDVIKPKDLSKINSKHLGELLWWSYSLGVTPEKLVTIIDEVGESTEQIKKVLSAIMNSGKHP
jgi:Protein of unknown function (DUF3606)